MFAAIFAAIALWEWRRPRRRPERRGSRWRTHVLLAALNSLVVRIIAPASGVSFALWAEERRGAGSVSSTGQPGPRASLP